MSSRSVFFDFVLLAIILFCVVSLAILSVRGVSRTNANASNAIDDTFSPRLVTVEQSSGR